MAYLSPTTLTCPQCGHTEPLTWVTGTPLRKVEESSKAYVKVHKSGTWLVHQTTKEITINCPKCATPTSRRNLPI